MKNIEFRKLNAGSNLFLPLVFVMVLTTGCTAQSNLNKVELPEDLPRAWASDGMLEVLPITTSLLALIEDDSLRQLVREALQNNPNLSATALRLKSAEHLIYGPKSRLFPKLNAGFSAERNNQAVDLSGDHSTENDYRVSVGFSWEVDLWGRLADEYTAAQQSLLSQREDYLLAKDALAARIIQTWINLVSLRRSVEIETERIDVIKRIETILIERFKDGIGSLDELSTAKSRTEIAMADLSARKTALNRSIRNLEVLLGRYPKGNLSATTQLPAVASPPVDIPANTLLSRPDVRSAMARVEAARHIAGAAKKARVPSFQLSGQVFKASTRLGKIGGATTHWGILGSLFQPLFEGGRLKNEAMAREMEASAELMVFRQVVLTAVNEVEDVLAASKDLSVQIQAIETALRESEKSSRFFEERYRQGLASIQNLLIAREQEISVKNRLNELSAGMISNRIDLALALGLGLDDGIEAIEGED